MTKNFETQIRSSVISRVDHGRFNNHKFFTFRRITEALGHLFSSITKFIYLLVGLTGLTGTVVIIFRVIHFPSISEFNMVLIFGVVCMSLAVSYAGFHGFFDLKREDK
jgi:hypothetical protein